MNEQVGMNGDERGGRSDNKKGCSEWTSGGLVQQLQDRHTSQPQLILRFPDSVSMQRSEELRGYISPTKDFSTNYCLENDGAKCNNRTQSTFLESTCLVTENRTRFLELDNDIS
jgi:hypothetical protein